MEHDFWRGKKGVREDLELGNGAKEDIIYWNWVNVLWSLSATHVHWDDRFAQCLSWNLVLNEGRDKEVKLRGGRKKRGGMIPLSLSTPCEIWRPSLLGVWYLCWEEKKRRWGAVYGCDLNVNGLSTGPLLFSLSGVYTVHSCRTFSCALMLEMKAVEVDALLLAALPNTKIFFSLKVVCFSYTIFQRNISFWRFFKWKTRSKLLLAWMSNKWVFG